MDPRPEAYLKKHAHVVACAEKKNRIVNSPRERLFQPWNSSTKSKTTTRKNPYKEGSQVKISKNVLFRAGSPAPALPEWRVHFLVIWANSQTDLFPKRKLEVHRYDIGNGCATIMLQIRRPDMPRREIDAQKAMDDEADSFANLIGRAIDPRKSLIEIDLNVGRTDPNVFVIRKYYPKYDPEEGKVAVSRLEVSRVQNKMVDQFNARLANEWEKLITEAVDDSNGILIQGIPNINRLLTTHENRNSGDQNQNVNTLEV